MKKADRYFVTYNQLDELRADGRGKGIILEILIFLAVMVAAYLGQFIVQSILTLFSMIAVLFSGFSSGNLPLDNINQYTLMAFVPVWARISISLFSTAGMIGVTILFLREISRRSMATAGCARPFWLEYGFGLLAGFGVFALAVGISAAAGATHITGISPDFSLGPWLLFFAGFLIQGFSEELLCRGCLMMSIARKNSALAGVLVNAALFACLHLFNSGITVLSFINLFLFGVFASLYYLWRGNIWGIAAFHSMWNFTQGNVFGILVSGGDFGISLFLSEASESGALINGGSFGLEGGLAVTAVLVAGIILIYSRNIKRIAGTPMPLRTEVHVETN